ncbi:MAG: hypothetical protein KDE47_21265, partial [Caldilineaceae bacterium]|nr:hypothetical protein [Caldilineaceae bacterium]
MISRIWPIVVNLSLVSVIMLAVACTPIVAPTNVDPAQPAVDPPTTPEPTVAATAEEETMTATPADSSAPTEDSPLVQAAKADLAQRLGIDAAEITVVEAQSVAWRDGSLGCPEPGMMYTQVIINGTKIVLSVNGEEYHYH